MSDPEWRTFLGTFFYLSAVVSFYRRDFRQSSEYLELFELHMPEGSYIQMIEANSYTVNSDSHMVFFENLHEAEAYFSKCIKLWASKENYPFVGFFQISYSDLLFEWNRLEEAGYGKSTGPA